MVVRLQDKICLKRASLPAPEGPGAEPTPLPPFEGAPPAPAVGVDRPHGGGARGGGRVRDPVASRRIAFWGGGVDGQRLRLSTASHQRHFIFHFFDFIASTNFFLLSFFNICALKVIKSTMSFPPLPAVRLVSFVPRMSIPNPDRDPPEAPHRGEGPSTARSRTGSPRCWSLFRKPYISSYFFVIPNRILLQGQKLRA